MKYKIYSITSPLVLKNICGDGYHPSITYDHALAEADGFEDTYDSIEDAFSDIKEMGPQFPGMNFTIIPFILLDYNGKIT